MTTTRPSVLILTLLQERVLYPNFAQLMEFMAICATVTQVETKGEFARIMKLSPPSVVVAIDAGISKPENATVLSQLLQYTKEGGITICCCNFSNHIDGMFLIPLLVGQLAASFVSGIMASRGGKYKSMIHTGFAIWAIGCGCISTISHKSNQGAMVVFMLLSGIGAGQTLQPTTIAAQASIPRMDMSVVTVFRNAICMKLRRYPGFGHSNNALRKAMNDISVSESLDDPSYLVKPTSETGLSAATVSYILSQGYTKGFITKPRLEVNHTP
ncbi:hypothetical protein ARMSODRAFT_1022977 [Armillaria solidipes]|uniref:Uncharacterized protein n=1 Tax=Armillaria solidipes TaxID=1076256 RepID=A0A2H3B1D5_9AGAR|nr:hypothetical protein ARMSODRAFT_1022977 [Armillaria solidipes]